jgi:menaquinone-dependent protoporphyrinogen oxidase
LSNEKKDYSFEFVTLGGRVLAGKEVLILYGTRYGSTEGISEKMAEIMKGNEVKVDLFNLKSTPEREVPAFDQYDGLLIGTGIKVGQWTKEVKEFVKKRKEGLNLFNAPKGFFVSSGYAADPEMYEKVKIEYTRDALDKIGVKIDYFDAFGGLMDFTETSRMSWLDKKILKKAAENDPKIDPRGWNDLRDWKQIEKFTLGFIDLLQD